MDSAKGLPECVEGAPRSLSRRVELREPGLCRRNLQLAVVPLATDLHESFVRLKIVRQAFRNVTAGRRALGEITKLHDGEATVDDLFIVAPPGGFRHGVWVFVKAAFSPSILPFYLVLLLMVVLA